MSKLQIPNNDDIDTLPDRRVIGLVGGRIEENLNEIEQALIEQRVAVFQRNGGLVLPGAVSVEPEGRGAGANRGMRGIAD